MQNAVIKHQVHQAPTRRGWSKIKIALVRLNGMASTPKTSTIQGMVLPVLTAILQAEDDPRALLHYADRDYTVKTGDQFADFKVISITADQVVLDRGGQRLILHRPTKGE